VVRHAFDVPVDGGLVDVEEFKEPGQRFVAINDRLSDTKPFFGEGGATVFDMFDQPLRVEFLEHVCDARLRDLKTFGNVDGARVSLFLNKMKNLLEIVTTPLSPLRSGPRAASKPSHQKKIPSGLSDLGLAA